MECWVARSGNRGAVGEFLVTDLGFQGGFNAGLDIDLSFFSLLNSSLSHWQPCNSSNHVHLLLPIPQTLYRLEHEQLEQAVTRSRFWGCGLCRSMAAAHRSESDLIDPTQLQFQSMQTVSASLEVCCTLFEFLGVADQGVWVSYLC